MQTIWVEAFLAVVDHSGFAAAAAHLYRSQGRLSSYIASLEQELGTQLFDRNQRPARLTAEGEAFLPYARSLLDVLDTGRSATLAVKGLKRGDVALGAFPSAGAEYVPLVLANFTETYPDIAVKLVERQSRGLDQALDSGETSIVIRPSIPQPICRTPFSYLPLWREQIRVIVPAGHPLAGQRAATAAELANEPLVIGGRTAEDAEITRLLSHAGVRPHIRYISNEPLTLVSLVRHGLAVGIINALALNSIRLDGLSAMRLDSEVVREVGVYWTAAAQGSTAATAMLRTIMGTPPPEGVVDLRANATQRSPGLFGGEGPDPSRR